MHHLIVPIFFLCANSVFAAFSTPLTIDGVGNIPGYSSVYQAFHYRPLCGTLGSADKTAITLSDQCTPAFQQYRTLPDTFALYDLTGIRLPDLQAVGGGTTLCMCFSIADVAATADKGDFCIVVGPNGEHDSWWSLSADRRAAGNFQLGTKSLPQCADINLAEVQSSLSAASATLQPTSTSSLDAGATGVKGTGSSTKQFSSLTPRPTSVSPPPDQQPTSQSSPGGPLSIGIWMPILISGIAAAAGIYYKWLGSKREKERLELEKEKALNEKLRAESLNLAQRLRALEEARI